MKQFTSHLDYLIQGNDCVIIPDFGGFVLNREDASIAPDGSITPPRVVVGFNPDLKYNDGLLAESYMYVYSISYDAACKKINDAVENLNSQLSQKRTVRLGHLGKINLTEKGTLNFVPDQSISLYYPDTYGLSYLNIRPLPEITKISARKAKLYKWCTGIAGAAAAVLVFFVTSTPIVKDKDSNVQQSGFFIDALSSTNATESNKATSNIDFNSSLKNNDNKKTDLLESEKKINTEKNTKTESVISENTTKQDIRPNISNQKNPLYYIIVGSANSQTEVNRITDLLNKDGMKGINTLEIGKNRYRIYIASFADRSRAEDYLINFRKSTSKYKDAWIYKSKI